MESAGNGVKKILILIEDGSFLFDNRVRREAGTLMKAGYKVQVLCPRYPGENIYDLYNGIHIYRYDKWKFLGRIGEYSSSLIKGFWLSCSIWKRHHFDCIQACNPPDFWFLIAVIFKFLFGVKFVFDQHDACPELYLSRFGSSKKSLGYQTMLLLEYISFKLADAVISTNESYKRIAVTRGRVDEKFIRIVRNGPDLSRFNSVLPDPGIKKLDRTVIGYLGNMNPQDGVDHLLLAARKIVHDLERKDFFFIFIGGGDSLQDLISKANTLNLNKNVLFTGRIADPNMLRYLSSCDICVQPDPKNPLNDVSTMNKVMEYMALGKPVVAYDLVETRYSGGDCVIYAKPNIVEDLAHNIIRLAEDENIRLSMGNKGRKRVENFLAWKYSEQNLIDLYILLFNKSEPVQRRKLGFGLFRFLKKALDIS